MIRTIYKLLNSKYLKIKVPSVYNLEKVHCPEGFTVRHSPKGAGLRILPPNVDVLSSTGLADSFCEGLVLGSDSGCTRGCTGGCN